MSSGRDDASENTGRLRATGAETALPNAGHSERESDDIVEPEQRDSIAEGPTTEPSSRQYLVKDNPQNSLWQQQRTSNPPDQTGNICVAAEGNRSSDTPRDEMISSSHDAEQDDAANTPAFHPETSLDMLSQHNDDARGEQEDPGHRWETRFGDQQGHDENSENENDDTDASIGQSDRVSPAFDRDSTDVSDPTVRTQAANTFLDADCDKAEEEADDEDNSDDDDERDIERQNINSVYTVEDGDVEGHGHRIFGFDAGNDTGGNRGGDVEDDQQDHEESSSSLPEDDEDDDNDTSPSGDDDESESESDDSEPESDESESDESESEDEDSDESESEDGEISDDDDDDD